MRNLLAAGSVFLTIFTCAAPAAAQDYKPVDINIGFGWMFPTTDIKNDFNAGWNGTIGATFNINEKVGIVADYTYARMNGPDKQILLSATPVLGAATNGVIQSNHQMHIGTFDALYKIQSSDRMVNGYVLGGGGIYHRIVQLTSPSVGYTTICDPFWYVCYPAAVSVDQIIGDRSENDFGINFGGGITFGHEAKFYVESRYHYVWGKTINPAVATPLTSAGANCSGGCTSNSAYFPLTFGVRW
jgi:Outer membrane protein beta-barrel domain